MSNQLECTTKRMKEASISVYKSEFVILRLDLKKSVGVWVACVCVFGEADDEDRSVFMFVCCV